MAKTTAELFWLKVDRKGPDDCWLWQGCRNNEIVLNGKKRRVRIDFVSFDRTVMPGRGVLYAVQAPFTFKDRHQFHGPQLIDGREVTVVGVEAWAIPEIKAGTMIGLLVKE